MENIIEKYVVYFWLQHDFKCSDFYDDNNSIRYNSIEFQERIMEEEKVEFIDSAFLYSSRKRIL